jgi:hypothetical protein
MGSLVGMSIPSIFVYAFITSPKRGKDCGYISFIKQRVISYTVNLDKLLIIVNLKRELLPQESSILTEFFSECYPEIKVIYLNNGKILMPKD